MTSINLEVEKHRLDGWPERIPKVALIGGHMQAKEKGESHNHLEEDSWDSTKWDESGRGRGSGNCKAQDAVEEGYRCDPMTYWGK